MELKEIIIHEFLNFKKEEGKKNSKHLTKINEIIKEWLGLYSLPLNNIDLKILQEKREFIKSIVNMIDIKAIKETYNLYWDVESQEFLFE